MRKSNKLIIVISIILVLIITGAVFAYLFLGNGQEKLRYIPLTVFSFKKDTKSVA